MFFKRLSRTRTDSYLDDYDGPPEKQTTRPSSSSRPNGSNQHNSFAPDPADAGDSYLTKKSGGDGGTMYPRPRAPQESSSYSPRGQPQPGGNALSNGVTMPEKGEPMPELLAQAFNQAIRPYTDKIEQMEAQMTELQNWADTLQQQRAELWEWIDKRGLRPDVPASIAKQMDTVLPDAASTLNAQLDRKITIVNFDLHRLQDDLNDSISAAHFAAAMAKFLPDISRLSSLPTGPRYAFDLILKLGGNLNSHGGVEALASTPGTAGAADANPEIQTERKSRRDFYAQLDRAMVEVVRRRFAEGEEWMVGREIKRIEKTAAYLRNYNIEPYFPITLDTMKREMEFRGNGGPPPHGTPPRYQ